MQIQSTPAKMFEIIGRKEVELQAMREYAANLEAEVARLRVLEEAAKARAEAETQSPDGD